MELQDLVKVQVGGCHLNKEQVFNHAWEKGCRLFDSGFGYSGPGVNDVAIGEIVTKNHKRDEFMICQKLPLYGELYKESFGKDLRDMDDTEMESAIRKVFDIQCQRCQTDYFDIYMYHAIYDTRFRADFDLQKETDFYIRVGKVLAKLKSEGKINHIGFSSHNVFEYLYYFVEEMEKALGKTFMDVAEVSYNVLNSSGNKHTLFTDVYHITVWDSAGEKGLKYLKDKGYFIIDMMPTESGRLFEVDTSDNWRDWNLRFIRENRNIDIVLAGTSSVKHFDQYWDILVDKVDLVTLPDMRIINNEHKHCHE